MGDQIQHQLAQLVNLFQEERAANIARQEAINARLDALIKDLVNSKIDSESTNHTSQNRGWKGKSGVAEGSKSDAGGSSFIPRYTKLDFPRFTGQGDPLGWLNRCDHFFRHQQTPDEEKRQICLNRLGMSSNVIVTFVLATNQKSEVRRIG
ncbi:hypothetical protein KY285_023204 [Solanum tuberosum]|nr:hypothetical protein KY284_023302 [Solanum tuberosum]KAH0675403.1 hypothetical protein KY285_023204 [Solanum tuberosum]